MQKPLFGPKPQPAAVPGTNVTVDGEVVRVTFENEETGFRVLRVAVEGRLAPETWVGVLPSTAPGTRVRATGRYERDGRHGDQLKVETLLTVAPSTMDGIERYLGSGMVPGIGPAFAKRIVEVFGLATLEILDRSPSASPRSRPGAGPRRVGDQGLGEAARHRGDHDLLAGPRRLPALAMRIYKVFGPKAIEVVQRSPYKLSLDVWGIGFKTADRIAQSIGIKKDDAARAQAGVHQTLHDLSGRGHVFAPRGELAERAAAMLELDTLPVEAAIDALAASRHVRLESLESGEIGVYLVEHYEAEVRLARRMRAVLRKDAPGQSRLAAGVEAAIAGFEKRAGVELAPAQRQAVQMAAQHKVLVLTGGPGVGKTTIVRAILSLFAEAKLVVRLAAPTGRAAKRMSEATGREAVTLHRLLEFDPKSRAFARRNGRPLEGGAVIIDEASMLDLALADGLLQAVSDDARLVLVGDVDQLPRWAQARCCATPSPRARCRRSA